MLISTKGRYALRVMIDLAENGADGYVPLRDIAARQDISEKYLENIIATLKKTGMLEGLRGKGGGYRLAKAPGQCTVGSILKAAEGTLAPVACLTHEPCTCINASDCKTLPVWKELDHIIDAYLENVTLADVSKSGAQTTPTENG